MKILESNNLQQTLDFIKSSNLKVITICTAIDYIKKQIKTRIEYI